MSRKKVQQLETSSIDRMDLFIKNNYKLIIGVVSAIIVIFLAGYGIRTATAKSQITKSEAIGQLEVTGLATDESFREYTDLADSLGFAADYINMRAATISYYRGDTASAIAFASKAGGNYKAQAESMLYDLKGESMVNSAQLAGAYSPIWYYRAVLAAEGESRASTMKQFKEQWPDSALLALLETWGM